MSAFVGIALLNACTAAVLALGAAAASLWIKRPAVAHSLWLLVLVELLAPPVIGVGVLPRPAAFAVPQQTMTLDASLENATGRAPAAAAFAVEAPVAASPPRFVLPSLATLVLATWILGSLGVAGLALARMLRFARLLREARPCDPVLQARVAELGSRLRLDRPPHLRVVDARVSPLVWKLGGSTELIFPAGLLDRLAPLELDAVLAHELAHVRRRDHWIRWLELLASTLYWWHPVTWWARTRLRSLEERSCDELVLLTFPQMAHEYARGLLVTLEFLARVARPVPALACGFGASPDMHDMKERLTMILRQSPFPPLRGSQRLTLALTLIVVVLAFPTWADRSGDAAVAAAEAEAQDAGDREAWLSALVEIELRAAQLEQELHELRSQQMEIERRLEGEHGLSTLDRRRSEADAHELALRRLQLEIEELEAAGQSTLARERRVELATLTRALAESAATLEFERRGHEEVRAAVADEVRSALERARAESGPAAREEIGAEIARVLARQLAIEEAEQDRQRAVVEEELKAAADRLRAEGREREAQELERKAEKLEESRRGSK